uniref:DAD domain-containing protein n=1 Tax=Haemonchus contortus TaxID=6289 RepID=A0A7I5E607_HAECO
MLSQSSGCSDVLECCLHGRTCRAGQRQAENKDNSEEESEHHANEATPISQPKSRQEEVIDRLARQLRHAEEHAERRRRRREARRRRRSEREEEKRRSKSSRQSINTDMSSRGDGCCAMNRTVNVSLPKTPVKRSFMAEREEIPNQMFNDGDGTDGNRVLRANETENSRVPDNHEGLARSIYIGVCNFAKAEEMVEKRADFKLYHQMIQHPLLDDLEPELPLYLVYKTANGSYRHYPVRTHLFFDSIYFYVETGEKRPIHHCSLNHLVRYYQINAQRHPVHRNYADPFPWWEAPSLT